MRIRDATEQDFAGIARLTLEAYRALDRWVGDDYAQTLADVAGRAGAPGNVVLVAEDEADGRLLGSVTLTLEPGEYFEWAHGVDGDCGFRMLAVDPAAQGRGAGPALVAACVERARAAGRRRMIIGSTEWMTTAHRIYERMGFYRVPELDQQWGDIRGLCFRLELTSDAEADLTTT